MNMSNEFNRDVGGARSSTARVQMETFSRPQRS
jgi:hypothetical protein